MVNQPLYMKSVYMAQGTQCHDFWLRHNPMHQQTFGTSSVLVPWQSFYLHKFNFTLNRHMVHSLFCSWACTVLIRTNVAWLAYLCTFLCRLLDWQPPANIWRNPLVTCWRIRLLTGHKLMHMMNATEDFSWQSYTHCTWTLFPVLWK